MNGIEFIGLTAGFLTTTGMIPQVIRLFALKSAHEISMVFILTFIAGIALWLVYGFLYDLISVVLWNSITLILGLAMLYAKVKWGLYD